MLGKWTVWKLVLPVCMIALYDGMLSQPPCRIDQPLQKKDAPTEAHIHPETKGSKNTRLWRRLTIVLDESPRVSINLCLRSVPLTLTIYLHHDIFIFLR